MTRRAGSLGSRSPLGALLIAAAVALQPACSFITVDGPPPQDQRASGFDCTTVPFTPLVEMLVAVGGGVTTAVMLNEKESVGPIPRISRDANLSLSVGVTVLALASAATGFYRVTSCREAKAQERKAGAGAQRGLTASGWQRVPQ